MTPTMLGRWETRLFILVIFGGIVSAIYTPIFDNPGHDDLIYFYIVGYVFAFGVVWDVIYQLLQSLRWDRDWPAVFQVANGIIEGVVLWLVIDNFGLPGIPEGSLPFWDRFAPHYFLVWLLGFMWVQGPMRTLSLHWRYTGGRLV